MPFIYSANRQKIELSLSPHDIGVNFDAEAAAPRAEMAARAAFAPSGLTRENTPRRSGHVMMLHQPGAARTAFATVREALPSKLVSAVRRTLPVYIENESGLRLVTTREITVRFKTKITAAAQQKLLTGLGLVKARGNDFHGRQYIVTPIADIDETVILELANQLSEHDEAVEYAAPNFIAECRKSAAPNDPRLSEQWHLNNTGRAGARVGEDVAALAAWDVTPGGDPSVVIAIIDDGVDIRHRDLRANIWLNPDPTAPDRNGRNFFDDNFDPRPRYFRAPYDVTDFNDIHGTPCAGVAAAAGNNRRGVAGVAYQCKILPVKIFGGPSLAPYDRVADAIRYAGQHAQVLSCSWGSPTHPDVEAAINDVTQTGRSGKGCLVFVATGNDYRNSIGFPARHPNALAVGASNDQGLRSQYSNYGRGLAFVAPSNDPDRSRQGITTTDVATRNRGYNLAGEYTDDFGGTSSATPLAAGIGALVLSVNPALTWEQARDLLQQSADRIDTAGGNYRNGYSLQYGYGRLNAHQAVQQAAAARTTARSRKAATKRKSAKTKTASRRAAR